MKIWFISDTHSLHNQLEIPEDVDMVIHSGDASVYKELLMNDGEMRNFVKWFSNLNIKHKLFIPGNHDTSIEAGMTKKADLAKLGITMLIDESITIEGIKIFGSPYTPSFGHGWAYNSARHKIQKHWELIERDTDIVVTHGPPKGVLDLTRSNDLAGCKNLLNTIERIQPEIVSFGHIHEEGGRKLQDLKFPKTTFLNSAVVDLGYNIINNGHIITI